MTMSKPTIAWSHSRIDAYLTCPRKLYETAIAKNFTEEFGEAANWGQKAHAALDRRLRLGAALPSNMSQYEDAAAKVAKLAEHLGMEIHTELALALDADLKPCGWKDWDTCWVRCALDVLLLDPSGKTAIAVDWKTGKRKNDDRQLALQAAMVFRHYPHVEEVRSAYCWLKEGGDMDSATFTRDNESLLWKQYLPVVRQLTDSVLHGDWPEKKSGLCREYCPVKTCRNNGAYRG